MSRNILFVTLGTRDVSIEKEALAAVAGKEELEGLYFTRGNSETFMARLGGAFVFNHYSSLKDKLKFPILEPAVKWAKGKKIFFDRVCLVATNQDEQQAGHYAQGDSLYFARIIQEALKKEKIDREVQFRSVEIIEIRDDVAYLDAMFDFFQKKLSGKAFSSLKESDDRVYLLNQGGIDAINTALMLNLLYACGDRSNILSVNEKTQVCTPLQFTAQFTGQLEKKRFAHALRRYDYAAIQDMDLPEATRLIAGYAAARLHFDFDQGREYLQEIDFRLRRDIEMEILEMNGIRNAEETLIREVYWNAGIKFRQGAYVDFVQRLFRIVEHLAKSGAYRYLSGLPDDHQKWKDNFPALLSRPEYQELKDYLDGYELNSGKLNYWDSPNIAVFMAILKYYDMTGARFIQRIQRLSGIRNKGIGAHGFEPISLPKLLAAMETDEAGFLQLWREVGEKLEVADDPFDRINDLLVKTVNR